MLHALSEKMPAEQFGRLSHLPQAKLATVVAGLHRRGHIGADGWLTVAGRWIKERVKLLADELSAPAYDILEPHELDPAHRNTSSPLLQSSSRKFGSSPTAAALCIVSEHENPSP